MRVNYGQLLLSDFALILLGFLLCRYTALRRNVWDGVDHLVYYVLFPSLLFYSIVKSTLDLRAASGLMTAGALLGVSSVGLTYLLPWLPLVGKRIDRRQHAASVQVGFRFNSFIGLAIAERLGGTSGLLMIALLIGLSVPVFNIAAVWPMAHHARVGFLRELRRNPLIIATVTGLLANLLGWHLPVWAQPTVAELGTASLPIGLMAAGAGMQFGALRRAKLLGALVLLVRHVLTPLTALAAAWLLGLSHTQATILLAFSALPTASSCYVLAARMGYDGAYVASLVTLSTLLGMLSLPFALSVLLPLLP